VPMAQLRLWHVTISEDYVKIRIYNGIGEGFYCIWRRESPNLIIPMVIKKLIRGEYINLTKCEEQYCFLYVESL